MCRCVNVDVADRQWVVSCVLKGISKWLCDKNGVVRGEYVGKYRVGVNITVQYVCGSCGLGMDCGGYMIKGLLLVCNVQLVNKKCVEMEFSDCGGIFVPVGTTRQ